MNEWMNTGRVYYIGAVHKVGWINGIDILFIPTPQICSTCGYNTSGLFVLRINHSRNEEAASL